MDGQIRPATTIVRLAGYELIRQVAANLTDY